mgnify:CR=1 FL=1
MVVEALERPILLYLVWGFWEWYIYVGILQTDKSIILMLHFNVLYVNAIKTKMK